jgi:predicted nucleic acid-binding protein
VRALLDANVVLDVLQRRQPWFDDAAAVMASAEGGRFEGFLAAHTATTIFYLMARHVSRDAARVQVSELLRFLRGAPVDHTVLTHALALPYADLEDGVQMAAAVQAGADYVVTRDRALYAAGPLPALAPGELLALLADA